jgi:long-subunit acyl-CoA synthetase (AMP-forming)
MSANSNSAEPIRAVGLARTLEEMTERLKAHPGNHVAFYEGGKVARRPFPEVYEEIVRVRHKLTSWGVQPGMRVGIFASNSYEWIVYDMALIQLGVTTVPFPDETPVAEIGGLFERYRLNLLLASSDLLPPYPMKQPVAFLDRPDSGPVLVKRRELVAGEERVPSIVFSSGSSGKLKALTTSGPGTMAVIERYCARYRFYHYDSFLVFLPLNSYQQRLMVYGCINYGVDLAVVKTGELLRGLKDFQPTLCLAPPILFESVHKRFLDGLRGQPLPKRLAFELGRRVARALPSASLREKLLKGFYRPLHDIFGGRIRLMWTGMAPVRRNTLEFFAEARVPLVETYGLTESGPIASNTPDENRIGSVGKPVFPGSVRLTDDGEILVERPAFLSTGYYEADPEDQASTYVAPGRIATGDIGHFDAEGFLYLKGRKKEIIVTSEGHKIHPEIVEDLLNRSPLVLQSVVFGNGLPHLAALLVVRRPDEDGREVARWLEEVQRTLPHGLRIEKSHITHEELTRENGLLTENLKLNRRAILQRYRENLS